MIETLASLRLISNKTSSGSNSSSVMAGFSRFAVVKVGNVIKGKKGKKSRTTSENVTAVREE